ncbi:MULTISPECIES: hypothetical protein [Devosia]|uniref:hypothetical protein n=1 Tax=Devosia sp. I507 TaxID=2083786 RepID=UPI001FE2DCC6|nr:MULTISPECIES: hypothetical protein [Devosia]
MAEFTHQDIVIHNGAVVDNHSFPNTAPRRQDGTSRYKAPRPGSRDCRHDCLWMDDRRGGCAYPRELPLQSLSYRIVPDGYVNPVKRNTVVEILDHIAKHVMTRLRVILGVHEQPATRRQHRGISYHGCVATRTDQLEDVSRH